MGHVKTWHVHARFFYSLSAQLPQQPQSVRKKSIKFPPNGLVERYLQVDKPSQTIEDVTWQCGQNAIVKLPLKKKNWRKHKGNEKSQ